MEPEEFEEIDDEDLKAQRLLELLEKDDDGAGVAIEYISGEEDKAAKSKVQAPEEEDEDLLDDY